MSRLYIAPVSSEWSERFDLETIDSFGRYWRRRRSPGCTARDNPDVVLECSVSTVSEPDVIPEDARDHDGQDGSKWVVVEIDGEAGEPDMEDVWFNSWIETEGRYHDLDHASGEIPQEMRSRGAVQEGGGSTFLLLPPSGPASFERGAENDADSQLIHRDADRHR